MNKIPYTEAMLVHLFGSKEAAFDWLSEQPSHLIVAGSCCGKSTFLKWLKMLAPERVCTLESEGLEGGSLAMAKDFARAMVRQVSIILATSRAPKYPEPYHLITPPRLKHNQINPNMLERLAEEEEAFWKELEAYPEDSNINTQPDEA